jgi:hypothetical protein
MPTEAVATIVAAGIAAVAAVFGAVVTLTNAARIRTFTRRQQWWDRFSWALDKTVSADPREYELGLSVLVALIDVPWATTDDNEMAIAVANVVTAPQEADHG